MTEALLPRQDSEHGSTFLGLGGEGRLVFNFAECFVNWEKGNVNQKKGKGVSGHRERRWGVMGTATSKGC